MTIISQLKKKYPGKVLFTDGKYIFLVKKARKDFPSIYQLLNLNNNAIQYMDKTAIDYYLKRSQSLNQVYELAFQKKLKKLRTLKPKFPLQVYGNTVNYNDYGFTKELSPHNRGKVLKYLKSPWEYQGSITTKKKVIENLVLESKSLILTQKYSENNWVQNPITGNWKKLKDKLVYIAITDTAKVELTYTLYKYAVYLDKLHQTNKI